MSMITWNISKEDTEIIVKIVKRAKEMGVIRDTMSLHMDIAAAHQTCPLRLNEFLKAERFDFMHDIMGIVNHINRTTGVLEDCFVPRYSKTDDEFNLEKDLEKTLNL